MYAFSIENFRRSEDEVSALLQLAKEKFEVDTAHLLLIIANTHLPIDTKQSKTHMTGLDWEADKLAKHGVRVRILGDTSLLPAVSLRPLEYFFMKLRRTFWLRRREQRR